MAIEAGQRLLHYRLIEKIGEGGMGAVWQAEDEKLKRHVALKILPEAMAADRDRRARFEREARAVAALNHPNIVTLHSVEEVSTSTGPVHFITMELVSGTTLRQLLPRGGFTLSRLLEIAIPLVDAVSCAHRARITHRDLKPDNIMIDRQGRLRVLDFGLAKLHEPAGVAEDTRAPTVTLGEHVVGTVAYMSPEQAEGNEVDSRSDIFSLGTILYEMATGEHPFRANTRMATIGAILKDEPALVTEHSPSLPRHAARVVRRCLAKEPERRYQTAIDLRNELEDLKAEVDSSESAFDSHGAATPRTRGNLRWIVAGSGAVLIIVLLFALLQRDSTVRPEPPSTSVPVTSAIGQETSPTWSPEGEFIAFGRVREGSFDVMVQPVAGGEAEIRAGGPGDETAPRWSPDGRYLAYVSTSEPGTFVYLVPPHGGTPRKLIDTGVSTLDIINVLASLGNHPWSRDSGSLLVSRATDSGQLAIFRVDRDTGSAVQLSVPPEASDDIAASYSADGERICFERRQHSRGVLMAMPAVGGDAEVLLADTFDNRTPVFRPDGRSVVFRSNRRAPAASDLWELDLATGSLGRLTGETRQVFSFSVSATNRVAYELYWHDTFLFAVDLTTGRRRQLTSHAQDNFGARFSPDGGAIAYHSTRTGNCEVFVHHLDGMPETRITDHPAWDIYPDWSPDGQQLVFASNREDDRFKLFIANSDGGGERLLVDQPISVKSPYTPVNARLVSRWSPDGRRIAYLVTTDQGTSLWTVRPDGGDSREVVRNVGWFDWYVDSEHAIYARRHGTHMELVTVQLGTGKERSLYTGPLMEMDVSPDGNAVAFCLGPGHMAMGLARLKLEPSKETGGLPRAVGEPEYVVRTEGNWHVHNGGWSPDSKSLVYTRDQDFGYIYELIEER